MLTIKELENKLLKDFRDYGLSKEKISKFNKETDTYERVGMLQDIAREVVLGVDLISDSDHKARSLDPPYMLFNGQIYQVVSYHLFRKCIRHFLFSIGMKHRDWIKFGYHITNAAKEPILLRKFVRHPKYIAFTNCVVDFETLEAYKFSPDIHVDHQLEYEFDLEQECPIWENFLEQVLPSEVARGVIQQFFGLAFLDRYNSENKVEKALILVGEGSNGKSVIFETMMNIFSSRNISNMGLNSLAKGGDEGQRNMAMLKGKRFNYCSEEQIGKVIQRSDIFKTLVSGEPIYARRIGEDSFRITNVPFLVFNMNKLPKFNDDTHGLYRRVLIVAFNVIIPDELQDKRLAYRLREERAGILRWLYEGYQKLKSNKFTFVTDKEMAKVKEEFVNSQDPVRGWINECGIRPDTVFGYLNDQPKEMTASQMYSSYLNYCEAKQLPSESQQSWGRSMSDKKFKRKRMSSGNVYIYYGGNDKLTEDPDVFIELEGTSRIQT